MATIAKQQNDYGLGIRGAVRALWKGLIDADQFYEWMSATIARGLVTAWYAGAAECDIQPTELTPAERSALQLAIAEETNHVPEFAASILNYSQARGAKLGPHLERAKMWTLRWQDIYQQAQLKACADRKFEWVLGPTKEHCISCEIKLVGKVKRGSYWDAVGVRPQAAPNWALACGGWRCACRLVATDKRCTPGRLPSLP